MTVADFKDLLLTASGDRDITAKIAAMNAMRPVLDAAFNKVAAPGDWKAPIDTIVTLTDLELAAMEYAVEFFTATSATVTAISRNFGLYHVKAAGYRAGPAGDH